MNPIHRSNTLTPLSPPDVNNPAQDDLTPLHYAARYTPKGTADMDFDEPPLVDISAPLPPTKVGISFVCKKVKISAG